MASEQCIVGGLDASMISSSNTQGMNNNMADQWNISEFDPPGRSTPTKSIRKSVARIPLTANVAEMMRSIAVDEENEFEEMYEAMYDDGENVDDFEKAAVYEFIESKQKSKYLFDGVNMIKIKPRKNAAIKAIVGKAYYLRHRLTEKMREKSNVFRSQSRAAITDAASCDANVAMGLLSDYVPATGLKVPQLIQQCVNEIESRSRDSCEEGIYRMSGSNLEIKKLKALFLADKPTDLQNLDIHTLTGTIKAFLRGLQEPLIPTTMWNDFVEAGRIQCDQARGELVKSLVMNLPEANRVTLAFLIPHLQRMSSCPDAKMPLSSMAKVFAPTIVGYSSKESGVEMRETGSIIAAMSGIMTLPTPFWDGITNGGYSCNYLRN